MLMVMTTCPVTGKTYWTGDFADFQSFDALVEAPRSARCPHCQRQHQWYPADAWLETGMVKSYFDAELEALF